MNKRTAERQGTQGVNGAGAELAEVLAPLVVGMTATRASLLEWVHAHGGGAAGGVADRGGKRGRSRGTEVVWRGVGAGRQRDPLTARVLEQIVLGVSARGYAGSLEPGPVGV